MSLHRRLPFLALCVALLAACAAPGPDYPKARKMDLVEDLHGVPVPDPYRWLEKTDSDETRAWIEAQNRLTFSWLEEIPAREKLKATLTKLWNYEKYGIPFQRGGRYFFSRNDGLQDQGVLYWTDGLDGEPRVLLDPNRLSDDGTVALSTYSVSDDGKWLAYGISSGGSDWSEWRVREVDTGRDLDDHIQWVKFTQASWDKKNEGFYYSRYEEPEKGRELEAANYFQKLCYHRIGTSQADDRIVYHRPDQKEWTFSGRVTDDGAYLIIRVGRGTERRNLIFYQSTEEEGGAIQELIPAFEASFDFIGNDGPVFWFFTDLDAPRGRVIAVDTENPAPENWRTLVGEREEVLRRVSLVNDTFIASYLKDAQSLVRFFDLEGAPLRDLDLPGPGSVLGFGGRRNDGETFYRFGSFCDPGTIFHLDLGTGKSRIFRRPKIDLDLDRLVTEQVFFSSKDGTRVPMFLTYRKGLVRDGNNPVILNGYGGFNIAETPSFSLSKALWMEMGGLFAVANIRGGGEYGQNWHLDGMKANKQHCFDDFIAAAEWLIEKNYTSPKKLAISGASNGGLLVGACMTQRPDLFGACLPAVGVMDMLRFNRFTIGWAWVSDYGSPDDAEEFKTLYAYSPYHNIHDGTAYPPTLVTTGDHDDRVVPGHSFKFAARLQEAQSGDHPILIRIETRAGHGAGKSTTLTIEEEADELAFLVRVLGIDY